MYRFVILHIIMFGWVDCAHNTDRVGTAHLIWNRSVKSLDFVYPNENARQEAIDKGSFIPGAAIPLDLDVYFYSKKSKIFITSPRFVTGVPVTLGYISEQFLQNNTVSIAPYPNLEMNTLDGNCDHITSVYRIKVDECNRLWVMDTGKLLDKYICSPQLLVFDLSTDTLISRYRFDSNRILGDTQLITPIVDIRDNKCDDAFVYIADVERYQLFVYDHKNNKSWSIRNKHFYPNPDYATFKINDLSFNMMDGLFGMALGPVMKNGDRTLYFHALSSVKEKFVYTSIIRNSTKFEENAGAEVDSFGEYPYKRSSQSASETMDQNGILFYGSLSENSIKCWNSASNNRFNDYYADTVLMDGQKIQFSASLKIVNVNGMEYLTINSIPFQKIANGLFNPYELNFHFFSAPVNSLVNGTKCQRKRFH